MINDQSSFVSIWTDWWIDWEIIANQGRLMVPKESTNYNTAMTNYCGLPVLMHADKLNIYFILFCCEVKLEYLWSVNIFEYLTIITAVDLMLFPFHYIYDTYIYK